MRRKDRRSGSADNWWLRSPNLGNSTNFWYVLDSGDVNNNNASNTNGVSFGFCNAICSTK